MDLGNPARSSGIFDRLLIFWLLSELRNMSGEFVHEASALLVGKENPGNPILEASRSECGPSLIKGKGGRVLLIALLE